MAVADWVSTTGKNLTTVYVTHGHGDHWFGRGAVRERFPGVLAVATPAVVEGMRKWSSPGNTTAGERSSATREASGWSPRRAPVSEEVLEATWAVRVPTGPRSGRDELPGSGLRPCG